MPLSDEEPHFPPSALASARIGPPAPPSGGEPARPGSGLWTGPGTTYLPSGGAARETPLKKSGCPVEGSNRLRLPRTIFAKVLPNCNKKIDSSENLLISISVLLHNSCTFYPQTYSQFIGRPQLPHAAHACCGPGRGAARDLVFDLRALDLTAVRMPAVPGGGVDGRAALGLNSKSTGHPVRRVAPLRWGDKCRGGASTLLLM